MATKDRSQSEEENYRAVMRLPKWAEFKVLAYEVPTTDFIKMGLRGQKLFPGEKETDPEVEQSARVNA